MCTCWTFTPTAAPLGDDATVEREFLSLLGHLGLKVADGSGHFSLLACPSDTDGVELREMGAQLAIGFVQAFDLDLQLRTLLGGGEAVVAGVEAAVLVNDVHGQRHDDEDHPCNDERRVGECERMTRLGPSGFA